MGYRGVVIRFSHIKSSCYYVTLWPSLFMPHCSNSVICMNDYPAIHVIYLCIIILQAEQHKNLIFVGPGGTGKSYLARKLAESIQVGDITVSQLSCLLYLVLIDYLSLLSNAQWLIIMCFIKLRHELKSTSSDEFRPFDTSKLCFLSMYRANK